MVTIITNSVVALVSDFFLPILYLFVFIFTVSIYTLNIGKSNEQFKFNSLLGREYQQIIGQRPTNPTIHEESYTVNFMYLMATTLLNIILLNILISVVADNFAKAQEKISCMDTKKKAKMLLAHERLMIWKRSKGQKKYVFICNYKVKLMED